MNRSTGDKPDEAAEDQPVDWLYLPRAVTRGLHTLGIGTVGDLMLIGLRQIGHCQPLARLSQPDWVVLVRMLRRNLSPSPPLRETHQAPSAGRSLAILGLPGSAKRVLAGYGVTHVGDLSAWTLGDLVAVRSIGASAVAAIVRELAGALPESLPTNDLMRDDVAPDLDAGTGHDAPARHRETPPRRSRRSGTTPG
ncbi:MAG: hypothetical protein ACYC5O_15800 [Anaerolineae bacterium]